MTLRAAASEIRFHLIKSSDCCSCITLSTTAAKTLCLAKGLLGQKKVKLELRRRQGRTRLTAQIRVYKAQRQVALWTSGWTAWTAAITHCSRDSWIMSELREGISPLRLPCVYEKSRVRLGIELETQDLQRKEHRQQNVGLPLSRPHYVDHYRRKESLPYQRPSRPKESSQRLEGGKQRS